MDYFKRELFDSSLTMTKEILKFLNYPTDEIEKKAAAFQQFDEKALRQSFAFFEEEQDLISFVQQSKKELEQVLGSVDLSEA